MDTSDLTSVERDVLGSLARSRVTASAVTVAADLWTEARDNAWGQSPDPTGLAVFVLQGLNERGLVTYVQRDGGYLREGEDGRHNPWSGLPMQIRLTHDGWAAAGFPITHGHVGHGSRHSRDNVKHTGDMTSYRNHHDTAVGGPIEKEDFATHTDHYPDHYHPLMYGDDDMQTKRTYTRVTPEIEASVIWARNTLGIGATFADIAAKADVPERTARYVLTDLPRLRKVDDDTAPENERLSLKERIVMTLLELGEVRDIKELSRILGRADSDHDIVHVLHSLHKQGKVDFTEDRGGDAPTRIHMTDRGRGLATKKVNGESPSRTPTPSDAGDAGVESEGTTSVIDSPSDPYGRTIVGEATDDHGPVFADPAVHVPVRLVHSNQHPLVNALFAREGERLEADAKALKYVEAANAIESIDPQAARDLMEKAEALNIPMPSPIEREYMDYVLSHPDKENLWDQNTR